MIDIQIAWDVVIATRERGCGARRRVAKKHGVVPSTITEALARFEEAMGVPFFTADSGSEQAGSEQVALTAHGEAFAQHDSKFLNAYQSLRKLVQLP